MICVHVEATDEASHEGRADAKIKALEEIDAKSSLRCTRRSKTQGDYRILVSPDHPTPLRTKTHSHGFVPFAIAAAASRPMPPRPTTKSRRANRAWRSRKGGS